jgi:hypothetical protein
VMSAATCSTAAIGGMGEGEGERGSGGGDGVNR